jgi:hypothetical protein
MNRGAFLVLSSIFWLVPEYGTLLNSIATQNVTSYGCKVAAIGSHYHKSILLGSLNNHLVLSFSNGSKSFDMIR